MGICDWANVNEKMKRYHDCEWGVPVYDDTILFEYLVIGTYAKRSELEYDFTKEGNLESGVCEL